MANDPMIQWSQASFFGIQVDEAQDAWHSGHVTDILELRDIDSFVVATETGGVWLVADNGTQLQLSDIWDDPDCACIAEGPDGLRHFFAGCTDAYQQDVTKTVPTIMETQVNEPAPLLTWVPTTPLPAGAGAVTRIVVISNLRMIVVACSARRAADTGGIYWSRIPASQVGPTPTPRPYSWRAAVIDDAPADGFCDLAIGSTIGATRREELEDLREITVVAGGKSRGVYVGQWDGADLVMARAEQVSGEVIATVMDDAGATSITSCMSQPNMLYAACSRTDGRLMQVLRSTDGGRTWEMTGTGIRGSEVFGELLSLAGDQGNAWNNRISVAPYDPELVAFAWQAGPFISTDGAATWEQLPASPHLHADMHALVFSAKTQAVNRTLYIGSDGGMASVDLDQVWSGGPAPYRSNYNRQLPTLQCYAPLIRQFYGGLDGSREQPGLVSVGLQDNGNVYSRLNAGPTPWVRVDGGDGGSNRFLADGALVHNIKGVRTSATSFTDPAQVRESFTLDVTVPPSPDGIEGIGTEAVIRPTFRNAKRQLLAAMTARANVVYGLYVDDEDAPRYHWEVIATLTAGASVVALGSFHGGTVFAGTSGDGRMFAIDVKQGTALPLPIDLPKPAPGRRMGGGTFLRIVAFSESEVFAILVGATEQGVPAGAPVAVQSYVVHLDTLKWIPVAGIGLPGRLMYGLATVPSPDNGVGRGLVVSTDDAVYVSRDDGATWGMACAGLPRRPHCGELRTVVDDEHRINIYLGTYGRSVWTARFGVSNE